MAQRLELQSLLKAMTTNVYFQPPSVMKYPCIKYELDGARTEFAGNHPYRYLKRYQVTVIDGNADSDIPDKVATLPTCTFDRFFVADNLNHFVFTLYF
jgi:hypothetical protein